MEPSCELKGEPAQNSATSEGVPETSRLPKYTNPLHSAVAIRLEDELKLADSVNAHLWNTIRDAIALLALTSSANLSIRSSVVMLIIQSPRAYSRLLMLLLILLALMLM